MRKGPTELCSSKRACVLTKAHTLDWIKCATALAANDVQSYHPTTFVPEPGPCPSTQKAIPSTF